MVQILAQPLLAVPSRGHFSPPQGLSFPVTGRESSLVRIQVDAWTMGAWYLSHSRCRTRVSFCPLVFSSTSLSVQLGDVQGSTDLDPAAPESVGHLSLWPCPSARRHSSALGASTQGSSPAGRGITQGECRRVGHGCQGALPAKNGPAVAGGNTLPRQHQHEPGRR